MNVRDLIGKRILVQCEQRYGGGAVEEVRVLEVSPSGQWTKLMNLHGSKYWKPTTSVALVEALIDLRGEPKPE
jgi:hypothetical protein